MIARIKQALARKTISFLAGNSGWDFRNTSTDRVVMPVKEVSTDTDLAYGTRETMTSDARILCQKFGIAKRILRQFANYTVGSCEVDFSTGDVKWDEMAEAYVQDVFQMIDYTGQRNFRGMAKLAVISMKRDGDVGFEKTKVNGLPQLIPMEADRIRSTAYMGASEEKGWIGGVKITGGRPSHFRLWNRGPFQGFIEPHEVRASDFVHLSDGARFDGIRPPTEFAGATLNHIHDMLEIVNAEKKGVKTAGRFAILIKSLTGGVPVGKVGLFGEKADGTGQVRTEEIVDGLIKYLQPGEEASSFQSNRPSAAWQGFMDFLIRDIATSFDLPYGFVWNMAGIGGPAVRLESKQAERTFLNTIELLEFRIFNPVISWIVNDGMTPRAEGGSEMLPFNPLWMKFQISRPSHPSIDIGRESVADLAENERGWLSSTDAAAARAANFYKNIRQKAREWKYVQDTAKEFGVPEDKLMTMGKPPQAFGAPGQPPQEDDMPPTKPEEKPEPAPEEEP